MHPSRRFYCHLALLVLTTSITNVSAFNHAVLRGNVKSVTYQATPVDTIRPRQKPLQPNPTSRQATKPMILPGTRLDPRFRNVPAQDPAVAKAAPAWLRVKAKGTPMYMIDGYGATAAQLRQLQQKQVASVNVLNGTKAAKVYGPNARNGMIVITTKAGLEPKD